MIPRFFERAPLGRGASRAAVLPVAFGLALAIALGVYCVLSVIAGPAGLFAYAGLEERRAEMSRNLTQLGRANEKLRAELDSLRSDADRAAREARGLGFLRKGEYEVIISGRDKARSAMEPGVVVPFDQPAALPDAAAKQIALGAGLAVLALSLAPRSRRRLSGRAQR